MRATRYVEIRAEDGTTQPSRSIEVAGLSVVVTVLMECTRQNGTVYGGEQLRAEAKWDLHNQIDTFLTPQHDVSGRWSFAFDADTDRLRSCSTVVGTVWLVPSGPPLTAHISLSYHALTVRRADRWCNIRNSSVNSHSVSARIPPTLVRSHTTT